MTKVTFNLEAQVNSGEVIVLLGSTAELGTWSLKNEKLLHLVKKGELLLQP